MGRLRLGALVGALAVAVPACRERAQAVQSEARVRDLVRQLRAQAERATGLRFKHDVSVLLRSRAQVRDYVIRKFDQDLPASELAGAEAAYKLFGLIPDSLDLRRTMIDLLTEQVAGYYDPDSVALFIPTDLDDLYRVRLVVSHELIHALQAQYTALDSLMNQRRQNDRRAAAQAVLEGQATFYQIPMLMPEQRPETLPEHWFWRQREVMREQQSLMPRFAAAPLWLRETLIFPYLGGADFVAWFARTHPGRQPYGAAMPSSTEGILHPDRYALGDRPVGLVFSGSAPDVVRYEDGLGEFEIGLLFTMLLRDSSAARGPVYAQGWGGDRYQVLGRRSEALVWVSVWDDAAARDRFASGLERAWRARPALGRTGRRAEFARLIVDGRPAVRFVYAPVEWKGWGNVPGVRVVR